MVDQLLDASNLNHIKLTEGPISAEEWTVPFDLRRILPRLVVLKLIAPQNVEAACAV